MNPQQPNKKGSRHDNYPTSPWTEAYQSLPTGTEEQQAESAMSKRADDSDMQSPTHDALSDRYNRGR